MPKPQIGGRVPQDLKDELDNFAEEKSITQSDALRQLLRSGLDHEQGVAADGGEVLEQVDALRQQQRREERRDAYETALLGGGVAIGVAVLAGALDGVAALLLGLGVGGALIATALRPLVDGSQEVGTDE